MHKVSDEKQASLYRSINRFLRKKDIVGLHNPLEFGSIVTIKRQDEEHVGYVGGMRHGTKGPAILFFTDTLLFVSIPGLTVDWDYKIKVEHLVDWCWITTVSNERDIHLLLTSSHKTIQHLGVVLMNKDHSNDNSSRD